MLVDSGNDVVTVSMALTAVSLPEISRWVKQPTWKNFWGELETSEVDFVRIPC